MQTVRPDISPDNILKLGTAFFASKTLLSAIELGVFSALASEQVEYTELSRRVGLHERCGRDFLDALVALGLLKRSGECYANSAATALYLDKQRDSYLGAYLEMANRRLFGYWNSLTSVLRTGEPQNEHGKANAFDTIYASGDTLQKFVAEMHDVSLPLVGAIVEAFAWQQYQTVIDIGTCKGAFPVALCQRFTHLQGGGFDLPPVRGAFEQHVREHRLAERLKFYPGDFHKDPLPTADVLVMGHVLVDWDVQTKKMLIAKAFEALPEGGALLIYEMIIDDGRRYNAAGLLMSLNMAIETPGGGNCTGETLAQWMRDAGFLSARVTRLSSSHSMLVGVK